MCAHRAHGLRSGVTYLDLRNWEAGPRENPAQELGTNPPLGPESEGPTQAEDSSPLESRASCAPCLWGWPCLCGELQPWPVNWRQTSSNCCLWWGRTN